MNIPTLEDVKNIADECANKPVSLGVHSGKALTYEQLQAFAQHWMKVQREIDAEICLQNESRYWKFKWTQEWSRYIEGISDGAGECADDIRNNTGE